MIINYLLNETEIQNLTLYSKVYIYNTVLFPITSLIAVLQFGHSSVIYHTRIILFVITLDRRTRINPAFSRVAAKDVQALFVPKTYTFSSVAYILSMCSKPLAVTSIRVD